MQKADKELEVYKPKVSRVSESLKIATWQGTRSVSSLEGRVFISQRTGSSTGNREDNLFMVTYLSFQHIVSECLLGSATRLRTGIQTWKNKIPLSLSSGCRGRSQPRWYLKGAPGRDPRIGSPKSAAGGLWWGGLSRAADKNSWL